jgi:hypothetical protein
MGMRARGNWELMTESKIITKHFVKIKEGKNKK